MARGVTPNLLSDARGTVALEFLIAFVPVLVLVLGTMQLVMIAAADLIVRRGGRGLHHAARSSLLGDSYSRRVFPVGHPRRRAARR
jgi:Flp pilus assembly protein TadG